MNNREYIETEVSKSTYEVLSVFCELIDEIKDDLYNFDELFRNCIDCRYGDDEGIVNIVSNKILSKLEEHYPDVVKTLLLQIIKANLQ